MKSPLPTGIVALLMTDVVASTELWREAPHAGPLLGRAAAIIGDAIAAHGGWRPSDQGEGDSTLAVFVRPVDALAAALDAQRALLAERWQNGQRVDVRMAIHTGEVELRDADNYGGLALIRCARIRALAHGGQVLVSDATVALTRERLPAGMTLVELETVALAGFEQRERVHQLCHPELVGGLMPLRRPQSGLPLSLTTLIGRERECTELAALLTRERLLTLTGAGGAGKTRLALAVATDTADRYHDGAIWVELGALAAAEQVTSAVAAACGVREAPGVPLLDMLLRHLAARESLLVLDNCEHLLDVCAELAAAIVGACPRMRILATGREPLGAVGETTWRVPSLSLPAPDETNLERIAQSGAVQLFVARATAAQANFAVDVATAPLVQRICTRLDGIPLALELAAARVRVLSLERLADGLDDRFRLLTGGARTVLARQRTLLASVEWSHALLDEMERVLFRRLSVFSTPFSLEAAEAVAADDDLDVHSVFELLAQLVEKSLVVYAGDHYRLLETLRQYALDRAGDADELAELRDRHLVWFTRRAVDWRLDREVATWTVIAEVAAVAPDLIAAADWSAARREAPTQILHALADYWNSRDDSFEAVATWKRIVGALEPHTRGWFEAMAATALRANVEWFAEAKTTLAPISVDLDPETRARLDILIAVIPASLGDAEAIETLRRSADVGRRSGNRKLEAHAHAWLGIALSGTGDIVGARALIPSMRRNVSPDMPLYGVFEFVQMNVAVQEGNVDTARLQLERALERGGDVGPLPILHIVGQWCGDRHLLQRALGHLNALPKVGVFAGLAQEAEVCLFLLQDDLERATSLAERADELIWGGFGIMNKVRLIEMRLALGDLAAAEAVLGSLRAIPFGTAQHHARTALSLSSAAVERARGDTLAAESNAYAALAIATERGMAIFAVDALELIALLAADRGALDDTALLLGATNAFRARGGYRWRAHYVRRALAAFEPQLPAGQLAAGAALSLPDVTNHVMRGRGDRGRPDHGWESLTPSESRVVELVAEGLTNAAVAQKLHVSLATVKTHLVHVFGKLGLATRAELAALTMQRRMKKG